MQLHKGFKNIDLQLSLKLAPLIDWKQLQLRKNIFSWYLEWHILNIWYIQSPSKGRVKCTLKDTFDTVSICTSHGIVSFEVACFCISFSIFLNLFVCCNFIMITLLHNKPSLERRHVFKRNVIIHLMGKGNPIKCLYSKHVLAKRCTYIHLVEQWRYELQPRILKISVSQEQCETN